MNKYEIWSDELGTTLIPAEHRVTIVDDNSILLKEFEANSWCEARQIYNDYFDFGKYNCGLCEECCKKI